MPIGVVDIVYASLPDVRARSQAAAADGFEHIDPLIGDVDQSVLPIGCPTSFPRPQPMWCACPAPPRGDDPAAAWERTLRWFRAAPGALLEPWGGGAVATLHEAREFLAAVPAARLCVDTGHVAAVDEDPIEWLPYADHVQIRQGAPGLAQLHVDDERGTVDFDAVLAALGDGDYRGVVSVEYFDLPQWGWSLDDPRAYAVDLLQRVRG